ncbi:S8 family peptidase [Schaalia vaccimaxillae]|uniref:S8 family peptidase n=1 Tax=Schaalia vaccimaxillae TaxID=183916 RepID=UPI0004267B2A|nr:S8 family serine peptidase [Schaalia vaccimaxillae]
MTVRRRQAIAAVAACAVGFTGLLIARPAGAEDKITTQPYVELLNLKELSNYGVSGKGVTIALVDGVVDTSAPELQGADITTVYPCPFTPSPRSLGHGTSMASLLVSPDYGIAPGAKIINYAVPIADEDVSTDPDCVGTIAQATLQALNDGVDIISYSAMGETRMGSGPELTRGDRNGVIFVGGTGNDGKEDDGRSFASANLTVGVGAVDHDGAIAPYSNYGKGVTVVAYGAPQTFATTRQEPSPKHQGLLWLPPLLPDI